MSPGARATPEGFYSDGSLSPDSSGFNCQKDDQSLANCQPQTGDSSCNSSAAGVVCQGEPAVGVGDSRIGGGVGLAGSGKRKGSYIQYISSFAACRFN